VKIFKISGVKKILISSLHCVTTVDFWFPTLFFFLFSPQNTFILFLKKKKGKNLKLNNLRTLKKKTIYQAKKLKKKYKNIKLNEIKSFLSQY
jgi:hypothetical protein